MENKQPSIWKFGFGALAGLLILNGPVSAFAATGAEFLRQESSPNAAWVMAGTAQSGGSSLMVLNPAGILGQDIASVSFTHFSSFVETAYEQMECLVPLQEKGTLAARVFFESTYNLTEINEYGEAVGTVRNYDLLLHTAYAAPWGKSLDTGIGVKLFQSVLAGYESMGAAIDLGAQYHPSQWPVSVGVSLQNLGAMTAYDQEADALPLTVSLGGAWQLPMGQHVFSVLLDLNYVMEEYSAMKPVVGLQYHYSENIFVRAAYRFDEELGNLMIGAGAHWQVLGLDYSYQPYGDLGENHRFTLSYFFKALEASPVEVLEKSVPQLQAKALPQEVVPDLKMMPRSFLGKITILPSLEISDAQTWQMMIIDEQENVIRVFSGKNALPKMIHWDGTNQQGQMVSRESRFFVKLDIDGKAFGKYAIPIVEPAVFLAVEKLPELVIPVQFRFHDQPETTAWQLLVVDATDNSIQAVFSGVGNLPTEQIWRHQISSIEQAAVAQFGYQLSVDFADGMKIIFNEQIGTVHGQRIEAPAGYVGIKIKGILFDFDRAELKSESADKLRAAIQMLAGYAGEVYSICEGHADEVGDPDYNQRLSEKRAHMVANKILQAVPDQVEYVTMAGYGKTLPENTWGTEEGRSQNRRVEIILFVPESFIK